MHNLLTDTTTLKLDVSRWTSSSEKPNAGLLVDGSNFPSNYRSTRDKDFEQTRRLHESLTKVVGGFRSLEFIDDGADSKLLVAKLFAEPGKPDYVVRFDELSDGQRALIVLYHLVTTFDLRHRSVFIDEPDNYVSFASSNRGSSYWAAASRTTRRRPSSCPTALWSSTTSRRTTRGSSNVTMGDPRA